LPDLTVVIPTWNEAAALPALLADLRAQQGVTLQLIVADGGSNDGTPAIAAHAGAEVVLAPRGRGAQMNAGAAQAHAEWLLFLHADSRLESATQLRDALVAVKHEFGAVAGHWPLHFARTGTGDEKLYRYLEAKTALNRPGTVNGDQGLLIGVELLQTLGGFDERLPFLEDQSLAFKIFERGRFVVLPGRLTTSARRFEAEGARRRYTLMSLIMGMYAAGAREYFTGAPSIYKTQDATGRLRLSPHLSHLRDVLLGVGRERAMQILWRAGQYTRQNAWQLFFWWDVRLGRPTRPCLRFYERYLRRATDNVVFDALTTVGIALWFLLVLPLVYAVIDGREG
jgi:rSAM/selenodomain-associated transferase 2